MKSYHVNIQRCIRAFTGLIMNAIVVDKQTEIQYIIVIHTLCSTGLGVACPVFFV
jgi:hypothetical protein